MKTTRREFLVQLGVTGTAVAAASGPAGAAEVGAQSPRNAERASAFNLSNYAAPPIDTVRVGVVGIGMRGTSALQRLPAVEGLRIGAICDIRPERVAAGLQELSATPHRPATYSGHEDAWKELCARDDLDLIYLCTPWAWHTPMAVFAMNHGKHVAVEVPAAVSLEECWQLVETAEHTKRHCLMLENCCYDFFELLTLNLARHGFFGEIVHGEGAYLHDLLQLNFSKTGYYDMWRLKENLHNGNLYPTHGFGPIAQIMNLNRGDQLDYLVSVQSDDFQMAKRADELAAKDPFYRPFAGKKFRGNMNTSVLRTVQGRTIVVEHDVTSQRPYSRIHSVTGTQATAQKWPLPPRISNGENWMSPEEMSALESRFTFDFVTEIGAKARQVGGHGGMDFIMDWRLVNLLRRGMPLDMDVYDAATWTAVGLASRVSVANRSARVDFPDFTAGNWKTNPPADLNRALT